MDKLNAGDKLTAGQNLTSPNGRYTLTMQQDGNLVMYEAGKPVWASNTAGSDGSRLEMQKDGNLVIYNEKNKAQWSSKTSTSAGATLALQDDRNLVVYGKDGKALWSSKTYLSPSDKNMSASIPGSMGNGMPAPTMGGAAAGAGPGRPPAGAAGAASAGPAAGAAGAAGVTTAPKTKPANAKPAGRAASSKAAGANQRRYTVAKGDSLWRIAEKMYGSGHDYMKIARANGIANPDLINVGQSLIIPE